MQYLRYPPYVFVQTTIEEKTVQYGILKFWFERIVDIYLVTPSVFSKVWGSDHPG